MSNCLFAFGCSFPGGAELKTAELLGLSINEWWKYVLTTEFRTEYDAIEHFLIENNLCKEELWVKADPEKKYYNLDNMLSLAGLYSSYPAITASKLGLDCVNLSLPGSSNGYSAKKAVELAFSGKIKKDDIIFYSVTTRERLSYLDGNWLKTVNSYLFDIDNKNFDYYYFKDWCNWFNLMERLVHELYSVYTVAKNIGCKIYFVGGVSDSMSLTTIADKRGWVDNLKQSSPLIFEYRNSYRKNEHKTMQEESYNKVLTWRKMLIEMSNSVLFYDPETRLGKCTTVENRQSNVYSTGEIVDMLCKERSVESIFGLNTTEANNMVAVMEKIRREKSITDDQINKLLISPFYHPNQDAHNILGEYFAESIRIDNGS